MTEAQIAVAFANLESVTGRLEKATTTIESHGERLAKVESDLRVAKVVGKWLAGVVGPLIVGIVVFILTH